jgi:hypothetical protein
MTLGQLFLKVEYSVYVYEASICTVCMCLQIFTVTEESC